MKKVVQRVRLLSLIAVLMCLVQHSWADEITWIDVSTPNELYNAVKKQDSKGFCRSNIRLTRDIDLKDASDDSSILGDRVVYNVSFQGKITGAGVDEEGNACCYAIKNAPFALFNTLQGAELTELILYNCTFDALDDESGAIAHYCENTTLDGILFIGIHAIGDKDGCDCDRMGSAIGRAVNSHFKNLMFDGCKLITDGQELGHVAGEATNCEFYRCVTAASCDLWADGNGTAGLINTNAYVGGICGYAVSCQFTECINMSTVSGDDDTLGGIVGKGTKSSDYSYGTTLTDCRNGGLVMHCKKDGFGSDYRRQVAAGLLISSGVMAVSAYALWGAAASIHKVDYTVTTTWTHYKQALMDVGAFAKKPGNAFFLRWAKDAINEIHYADPATTCLVKMVGFIVTYSPVAVSIVSACLFVAYQALYFYDALLAPDEVGGIAGRLEDNGKALRCVNEGALECCDDYCGGIVGYLDDGATVESCFNRSFVRAEDSAGGIVGYCGNGTVKYCLNCGSVSAKAIGDIVAVSTDDSHMSGNYYLSGKDLQSTSAYGFTQEKLPSGWVAKQLNDKLKAAGQSPIWCQTLGGENGDFYPTIGKEDDESIVTAVTTDFSVVQKIYTGGEFYFAVNNVNAQISLQDDIDLSEFKVLLSTKQKPFKGRINGNGHSLANFSWSTSEESENIALFPYASGATFENLGIDNFDITQTYRTVKNEALLVAQSDGCRYTNVQLKNSMIHTPDGHLKFVVGGIAASSNSDTFTNCYADETCYFESISKTDLYASQLGGFAGAATASNFILCHNNSRLFANDDKVGGMVGAATNCIIQNCLNSGRVTGQKKVGGMAGYAENTTILCCANVGVISSDDGAHEYIGGIVGLLDGSLSKVGYCLGFGDIENAHEDNCGGIDGACEGNAKNIGENKYNFNHSHHGNLSNVDMAGVNSGSLAYDMKDADGNRFLYQSIDNGGFVVRGLPVPIPAAGTVYYNKLCNGGYGYSNIYNATSHQCDLSPLGICRICGLNKGTAPDIIEISTVDDVKVLAAEVNRTHNTYIGKTISLTSDLDFTGVTDFSPIGCDTEHTFAGTFNGNGHRIKNLVVNQQSGKDGVGFFGMLSANAKIQNLIIDESCSFSAGNANGVAGLVGGVYSKLNTDGSLDEVTIDCCGNEASVYGNIQVGGLVGSFFGMPEYSKITITNCYNTGSVTGSLYDSRYTTAIIGCGGRVLSVGNCYNTGYVTGGKTGHTMISDYFGYDTNFISASNNYQYSGVGTDQFATAMSADEFVFGVVAERLGVYWGQNIGVEAVPSFPAEKHIYVRHERKMSNVWGTAMLPYEVTVENLTNCEVYRISSVDIDPDGNNGTVTLKSIERVSGWGSLDANTPFFIKRTCDAGENIRIKASSSSITLPTDSKTTTTVGAGWSVVGTYDEQTDLTGVYYIAQDKFWWAEDPISVPAFRSYLTYSSPQQAASRPLALNVVDGDGESTQIGEIRDGEIHMFDDEPVYNLNGKRQQQGQKGLQVRNGKVIMVM